MDFVLDASVALGWLFPDESNEYADGILRLMQHKTAITPAIWPVEVANALLVGQRRGRMTVEQVRKAVELLSKLRIEIQTPPPAREIHLTVVLSSQTGLSAYDASYLELAERYSIPVATADEKLRNACVEMKIALL